MMRLGAKCVGYGVHLEQPGYVAPEVLDPYLPFTNGYGPEVDLWSLGVVLYIMLCGFPPFYDDSTAVLFKQIRKGEYAFPSPYWDGVSDEAKDLVAKVLVVDPGKRYSAQQCLDHPWITNAGEASAKKLHSGHRAFLLIRKLPIFDNIDPACLQQVTAMLKVVKVEQGKHVIQAGEVGDCMYFINSGTVQVFVNGNEVDRLTTGDFFGEVALTVSKQRTADVKSLGNTKGKNSESVELFQLMRSDFEAVMERFPILKTRLAQIGQVPPPAACWSAVVPAFRSHLMQSCLSCAKTDLKLICLSRSLHKLCNLRLVAAICRKDTCV